jgi:hypothetical protein
MFKKLAVALSIVLCFTIAGFAITTLETYKAPSIASAVTLAPQIQRFASVTAENVALLDLFPTFSVGVRLALEPLLPITSWDALKDVTYTPYSYTRNTTTNLMEWVAGKPRLIMSDSRALVFWLLFDLQGEFTWFGTVVANG